VHSVNAHDLSLVLHARGRHRSLGRYRSRPVSGSARLVHRSIL